MNLCNKAARFYASISAFSSRLLSEGVKTHQARCDLTTEMAEVRTKPPYCVDTEGTERNCICPELQQARIQIRNQIHMDFIPMSLVATKHRSHPRILKSCI